jgi:hypothetical protein
MCVGPKEARQQPHKGYLFGTSLTSQKKKCHARGFLATAIMAENLLAALLLKANGGA